MSRSSSICVKPFHADCFYELSTRERDELVLSSIVKLARGDLSQAAVELGLSAQELRFKLQNYQQQPAVGC